MQFEEETLEILEPNAAMSPILKVLDAAMGGDNTAAVEAEKLRRWLARITQEQKNPE